MKIKGLRKYYFEKKLKQKENLYFSDKKMNFISARNNNNSEIDEQPFKFLRYSTKPNLFFNEKKNKYNIRKNLFVKENIENYNTNENSFENKDTQEDILRKSQSKNNIDYFRNNLRKSQNRINELKMKLSSPLIKGKIYKNYNSNNNEEKSIKKEKCYRIDFCSQGYTCDLEIDNLINSTTSKIENEMEKKKKEEYEFKKYLEKVKKEKLSKNHLTKGSLAIIQMQMTHAKDAIENNKYISFININNDKKKNNDNNGKNNICFRLGKNNMCVCGHTLLKHNFHKSKREFNSNCKKCECNKFQYIPVFPEETSEYTKAYLLDFKYDDWKAGCKCDHNWTNHNFNSGGICNECKCKCFESNFFCGVCGNPWENHIILFETKEEREKTGKPVGANYEPFTKEQLEKLFN